MRGLDEFDCIDMIDARLAVLGMGLLEGLDVLGLPAALPNLGR